MMAVANQIDLTTRRAFTLVELLVVIAIVGILAGLILPAVQSAREAARRAACTNNLKQIALAAHSYHNSAGCFPMGGYYPNSSYLNSSSGPYTIALLPHLEQAGLFDSVNFDVPIDYLANATVHATGVAVFWCPSDPAVSRAADIDNLFYDNRSSSVSMRYCSYGGNSGTWIHFPAPAEPTRAAQLSAMNGIIYENSTTRMSDVRDGMSMTMLLLECAHGKVVSEDRARWHWWTSPIGTQFTTLWPLNPHNKLPDVTHGSLANGGTVYSVSASSYHPGGANFAFVDGSIRFVKDSIDSWPVSADTAVPVGLIYTPATRLFMLTPTARVGVYQALSSRNGNEITSGGID